MAIRKLSTAAVTLTLFATAAPVAGASGPTMTPAAGPAPTIPGLIFVPPAVGPICVAIGPIILGGTMTSPGMHVCTTGTSPSPTGTSPSPIHPQ